MGEKQKGGMDRIVNATRTTINNATDKIDDDNHNMVFV